MTRIDCRTPSYCSSRALAIDEAFYGPEDPKVAIDLNNLAMLLQDTNRLEDAELLIRQALGHRRGILRT